MNEKRPRAIGARSFTLQDTALLATLHIMNSSIQTFLKARKRSIIITAIIGGLIIFIFGQYLTERSFLHVTPLPAGEEQMVVGDFLPASTPVQLIISKLGLEASFEGPLGLSPDGTMEVPRSYDDLGWYQYGPTPGELGPAVIVGHVDSYEGPAVFWPLGQLEIGDEIQVGREDGTTAVFIVTEMGRYGQSAEEFPTAKVYSDLPYAGLRLITCSGYFDRGTQRYSHNLVVYARLVDTP